MPQLTLKVSKNIDINLIDFRSLFAAIHEELRVSAKVDITTCHSGVIQEDYSYIGLGNEKATKVYLEVYWLETPERLNIKASLAQTFMRILEEIVVPSVEKQNLMCIPRVRIANLGQVDQEYHICKRKPA